VLKIDFALERHHRQVRAGGGRRRSRSSGTRHPFFFIVDAPAEAFRPLAAAVRGREVLLFNATAPDDWLRRELCAREIVHTLPSLAMTSDASCNTGLAQVARHPGAARPAAADAATTKAFENSVKKFGAAIIANRPFKPGTGSARARAEQPLLLTAGTRDYDVIFIADDAFEFARQVPYQTVRPADRARDRSRSRAAARSDTAPGGQTRRHRRR